MLRLLMVISLLVMFVSCTTNIVVKTPADQNQSIQRSKEAQQELDRQFK